MYRLDFSQMPKTVMFGRFIQTKSWAHNGQKNKNDMLVIIIGGNAVFNVNDKEISLVKDEVLYIPSNTFYTACTTGWCEYYFFHFKTEIPPIQVQEEEIQKAVNDYNEISDTFYLPDTVYNNVFLNEKSTIPKNDQKFYRLISNCLQCKMSGTSYGKLSLDLYFTELLLTLSDIASLKYISNKTFPSLIIHTVEFIQKNYTQNITLSSLSDHFNISKSYLIRIFKSHLHTTVTAYINDIKLQHARELLKTSSMNISEISDYLSFSSCYYFSRIFKKKYLVSPKQFR